MRLSACASASRLLCFTATNTHRQALGSTETRLELADWASRSAVRCAKFRLRLWGDAAKLCCCLLGQSLLLLFIFCSPCCWPPRGMSPARRHLIDTRHQVPILVICLMMYPRKVRKPKDDSLLSWGAVSAGTPSAESFPAGRPTDSARRPPSLLC